MANLPYPVPAHSVFCPDGPVFLSCGLTIMDVNYSPNPEKTEKLLILFAYLFTFNPEKQALQLKGILLKRFYWKFRAT